MNWLDRLTYRLAATVHGGCVIAILSISAVLMLSVFTK